MGSGLVFAFFAALAAAEPADHRRPAPNLAEPRAGGDAHKQALLSEMWQRRLLSSDSRSWTAEDLDTLMKLRAAEAMGAVDLLKRRTAGALGGFVVPYRPAGSKLTSLRLTKEGFERWRFVRSQDALELFDRKGVGGGLAFQLQDLEGRKLFDSDGLLTAVGDTVYNRIVGNLPVWWKSPHSGEVFGTRPPPKAKPPADPMTLPVTIGPEHPALMDRIWRSSWGRPFQPELRRVDMGKLRLVMEHDATGVTATGAYVVVVKRAADKAAARAEFAKRLPDLGAPEPDAVLTVEEKLAAMDRALAELSKRAEPKVQWSVDRAAVERQLRELLEGKLAVVWVLAGPVPPEPAPEPEPAPAPPPAQAPAGTVAPPTPAAPPPAAPPPPSR
jgi:hypothetical protein